MLLRGSTLYERLALWSSTNPKNNVTVGNPALRRVLLRRGRHVQRCLDGPNQNRGMIPQASTDGVHRTEDWHLLDNGYSEVGHGCNLREDQSSLTLTA